MTTNCPLCTGDRSRFKFRASDPFHGIPGEWTICECESCKSLFVENAPSDSELARLYPEDSYYAYSIPARSRVKGALLRALGFSRETGGPQFPRPGRVLDFGCGAGEFLLAMRARGWDCVGVEISGVARDLARRNGLDVRESLAGSPGAATPSFDYVRANHSLEHVRSPAQTLREIFDVMKPGGTLFIGVPTCTSQNARLFGPNWWYLTPPLHPFVPSTEGILSLIRRSGFEIKHVRTNSDYASVAGSLQILLNRGRRRANKGVLFRLKPLLLIGHWLAKAQDAFGVGDKLEVIAVKPSGASPS